MEDLSDRLRDLSVQPPSHPTFRVFAFDIETTGLSVAQHAIIDLSIVDVVTLSHFSTLLRHEPRIIIPSKITEITSITQSMVDDAALPCFPTAFWRLKRFVDSMCGSPSCVPVFVAHNGHVFDFPMLLQHCVRHDLELPKHWHYYDTLRFARTLDLKASARKHKPFRNRGVSKIRRQGVFTCGSLQSR